MAAEAAHAGSGELLEQVVQMSRVDLQAHGRAVGAKVVDPEQARPRSTGQIPPYGP
ncbi:hypothetical protein ACIBH1_11905 [Nonomuraea sp. NPDC050663]|uniref:hypothetical protein n=1 Tax=Nonomuraea sp. NPDC050663 TaxID=3364370 RepID=UPI00378C31F0